MFYIDEAGERGKEGREGRRRVGNNHVRLPFAWSDQARNMASFIH